MAPVPVEPLSVSLRLLYEFLIVEPEKLKRNEYDQGKRAKGGRILQELRQTLSRAQPGWLPWEQKHSGDS